MRGLSGAPHVVDPALCLRGAAAQGVELVDFHGAFLGHGLTSADGWMSGDCAHPTTLGHHELRRVIWEAWTGETP